jgi:mRNA interferase HigB
LLSWRHRIDNVSQSSHSGRMRVIAIRTLKAYWDEHPETREHIESWYTITKSVSWKNPNDIKAQFRNASILKDSRVVFNIKGNNHRLIVKIHYNTGIVFIRFIGTHKAYNQINAEEV